MAETRTPYNIFHLLLVCVALRSPSAYQPSFVSPSPSIPVSSYPRLVYVYACAYAYANVLTLPPPSRVHPFVADWVWDFSDHLARLHLLLLLTEWCS
ncbi:hypothetical protein B0H13DRAFT_2345525 [Mycena leptocephala]|nr:hypothetical protein B0H13DRAFT_2345525 [Mycena leptocephala]